MSDTERYFGGDFEAPLWTGVFIQFLAQTGWMVWGIGDGVANINASWAPGNSMTNTAWWFMRAGHESIYITAFVMFCISFIKQPKYQRYFYESSVYLTLISWGNSFLINLFFLIGGAMSGGNWSNLLFPFVYDLFSFIWQAIIYFMFYQDLIKFYRWDEQEWWGKDWWNKQQTEDSDQIEMSANDF